MAIYTPRGLKIRFSVPYCFSLMARIYPEVTPYNVLKTTEGIENISDLLAVLAAFVIILINPSESFLVIGSIIMTLYLIGYFMKITGVFFIPMIVPFATLFSYVQGYGIITVVLAITGYIKFGLTKTVLILVVLVIANLLDYILELLRAIIARYKNSPHLTVSELDFLNAYQLYAAKVGASIDIYVSEEEIAQGNWQETYIWLKNNWPEITYRFEG